jgi:hypothetical protein
LSDAFILTKTVTYVSSLPVTYVTSLYTLIARGFCFRKIHRRKAKTWRFFLGKSEKLRFSAGDH